MALVERQQAISSRKHADLPKDTIRPIRQLPLRFYNQTTSKVKNASTSQAQTTNTRAERCRGSGSSHILGQSIFCSCQILKWAHDMPFFPGEHWASDSKGHGTFPKLRWRDAASRGHRLSCLVLEMSSKRGLHSDFLFPAGRVDMV